ncbi:MAG TPA: Ig-like domain-containing protein [Terriglobales bacterium]|nr:Ig-like domain-containing protein [Terriglobales bacterium]
MDPTLNSIIVTDSHGITTPSIDVGHTEQMQAIGVFSDNSRSTITAAWSSSAVNIATIDSATGLLTAVAPGTTTITAANSGLTGTASVTVCGTQQAITIQPQGQSFALGTGTVQFTATAGGQDVTASVTWSSSNTAVATISNSPGTNGLVTFVGTGTTTIKAASCSQSSSTLLTVF